jgi:single-strand selective monofunctional uracil DNA glycosylase
MQKCTIEPVAKKLKTEKNIAVEQLKDCAGLLRDRLSNIVCSSHKISHVYNPLEYAWKPHCAYIEQYACHKPKMLLVGLNPGPWGMSQTGIPFGEIHSVTEFLNISKDLASHHL